jgi:hypothetical protein
VVDGDISHIALRHTRNLQRQPLETGVEGAGGSVDVLDQGLPPAPDRHETKYCPFGFDFDIR